jgi:hypothetical protein
MSVTGIDRESPPRAPVDGPAAPVLHVVARSRTLTHAFACLILVGSALLLFRLSLFQGWTFIGDPDRLNNVMNVLLFEVISLLQRGSVPSWNEYEFMGYGVAGVHWMLPGAPPLPQILAMLPLSEFYHALAVLASTLFAATTIAAYWGLGAYSSSPVQRIVGAFLYATGAYTLHKLSQLDLSFVALVAPPILHRLVTMSSRERAPWTFLGMAVCWSILVVFTVLQEVAYIGMFWGLYAVYRSVRLRDPWPLLAAGLAFAAGVILGGPRIVTIATEMSAVSRTSNYIGTQAVEAVRYFGDGLLGRSFGEQRSLFLSELNLHEGVQLLGSSLAALAVIAYGLITPSRVMRFWSVALLVVLSVGLRTYLESFYQPGTFGILGAAYPSPELLTISVNAVLIGVPAWLLGCLLTRGTKRRSPARDGSDTGQCDLPAVTEDLPFLFGFVVIALAAILIPEIRTILYYAFLKVDFHHSRICVAMTLPLAALVSIMLNRFIPAWPMMAARRWLAAGLLVGLIVWVGREVVAAGVVAQVGPVLDAPDPGRLLTLELVRVLTSLLLLLVAVTLMVRRASAPWLAIAGGALASWMVVEAVGLADHRLNGPSVTMQDRPFAYQDYMQVPSGQMRVPSVAERAIVQQRLESDRYRTLLVEDDVNFPTHADPHLAAFWGLRLVEGYSTGSPRRYAGIPWNTRIAVAHNLNFRGARSHRSTCRGST